jgi:hypothetical protein
LPSQHQIKNHKDHSTNTPRFEMKKQVGLSLLMWCIGLPTTAHGFVVGPSVPVAASRFGRLIVNKDATALFDQNGATDDAAQMNKAQHDDDILRELMEEMKLFEEQLATVDDELATMRKEWASLADNGKKAPSGKRRSAPLKFWST